MEQFKNIIFDLGGVILNIDYHKTVEEFEKLGLKNFNEIYSQAQQTGLFDKFEVGEISSSFFINELLNFLPKGTSPNAVVKAWNAIILDFPIENLNFLLEIKEQKNIVLLSNTNEIHIQCFHRKLELLTGNKSLHPYFKEVYFSNEIKLRKPNLNCFEFVCKENNFKLSETIFIDDSIQHIEGAKSFGLNTIHFNKEYKLLSELLCKFV
jgi:glucose-1-phosphatase